MTEVPYSNREIKTMFTNIETVLKDQTVRQEKAHVGMFDKMDIGFTQTNTRLDVSNGRLKSNELRIAYASGGLAIVALIVVPLLAWALFTLVNLQGTITDVVATTLDNYEFEISE